MQLSRLEERRAASEAQRQETEAAQSTFLEPTQKLSDVERFALFPE